MWLLPVDSNLLVLVALIRICTMVRKAGEIGKKNSITNYGKIHISHIPMGHLEQALTCYHSHGFTMHIV